MVRTWREADHPRDPANGEFVDKTGWAGRVVTAMFGGGGHEKAEGHDIRTKLDYDHLEGISPGTNTISDISDPALGEIAARQGFDGTPEVVDAMGMDRRVAAGWTELWRGVRGYSKVTDPSRPYSGRVDYTAAEAAEQFRTGDYFPGMGVFGNGTYTATNQDEALGYGDYYNGGLIRMALRPDARVVDWDELLKLGDKYKAAHWATGAMIRAYKGTEAGTPQRGAAKATTDRLVNKTKVLADMGRLAAAMGYDAIAVQPRNQAYRDGRAMYYVILNRTAVAVQEAE